MVCCATVKGDRMITDGEIEAHLAQLDALPVHVAIEKHRVLLLKIGQNSKQRDLILFSPDFHAWALKNREKILVHPIMGRKSTTQQIKPS